MNKKEYEEKLECLITQAEIFNKQIEELKNVKIEEDGFWEPVDGDSYYCIFDDGEVNEIWWNYHEVHSCRLSIGNVFKTKEESLFEVERLKVIAELKQFSRKFKYGLANYYIEYDYTNDNITYVLSYTNILPSICFESKERFREAVESVGEDRIEKYLFGIEY